MEGRDDRGLLRPRDGAGFVRPIGADRRRARDPSAVGRPAEKVHLSGASGRRHPLRDLYARREPVLLLPGDQVDVRADLRPRRSAIARRRQHLGQSRLRLHALQLPKGEPYAPGGQDAPAAAGIRADPGGALRKGHGNRSARRHSLIVAGLHLLEIAPSCIDIAAASRRMLAAAKS